MTWNYPHEKPKTLADGLLQLYDFEYIAVGSASGYVYIGTKEEAMARSGKNVYYRQSIGEPKLIVFIISGREAGKLWCLKDYDKAYDEIAMFLEKEHKNSHTRGRKKGRK